MTTSTKDDLQRLIASVQALDWPADSLVVVGGSTLVAYGILEWDDDIDMAVTEEIFNRLVAAGWQQYTRKGKPIIKQGLYDVGVGFGDWSLEELRADAIVIQGIPFMSLQKLRQWKLAEARDKDLKHVALIDAYLKDRDGQG